MKYITIILVILCSLTILFPVYAKGKQEEGYAQVTGIKNWNHTFDITERKPGKYNLIIRARDQAGNVTFEGPFNIFIDPESDLPIVSITNPVAWMRVGSTLNIVGTCSDDDAVASVELKIDDGEYKTVDGTEFWSYYLEVKDIPDGEHTVTVRGVDSNGKTGNELSVPFHLDKNKPFISVANYVSGDLISGNVAIQGKVTDANGIDAVFVSVDDGQTYEEIPVRYHKNDDMYTFTYREQGRTLEDGPRIYWFKAVDQTNSVGHLAFLLFIDNTPPSISVVTPSEDQGINGIVPFAGEVQDDIGITELFYQLRGEDPQEIPIVPGNPYWNTDIDVRDVPGRQALITFLAKDFAGNERQYRTSFGLDHEADLPVVTVLSPKHEEQYTDTIILTGLLQDDDAGKAIRYSLNRGEEKEVLTKETFTLPLEDTVAGENELKIDRKSVV